MVVVVVHNQRAQLSSHALTKLPPPPCSITEGRLAACGQFNASSPVVPSPISSSSLLQGLFLDPKIESNRQSLSLYQKSHLALDSCIAKNLYHHQPIARTIFIREYPPSPLLLTDSVKHPRSQSLPAPHSGPLSSTSSCLHPVSSIHSSIASCCHLDVTIAIHEVDISPVADCALRHRHAVAINSSYPALAGLGSNTSD